MLSTIAFLLTVSARRSKCNKYSSSSSSSESRSSSSSSDCVQRRSESSDCFIEENHRRFNDSSFVKSIVHLTPFLSNCKPINLKKNSLPFIEFADIAQFYVPIPDAKKTMNLFTGCNIEALVKLARKTPCFINYDAFNALFYNADCLNGIAKREFDSNYIQFFLARYLYFLDLFLCGNNPKACQFRDNCLVDSKTKKEINFFNLPSTCTYKNCNFGSNENALRLFNSIITDTTSTKILCQFIACLIKQVDACYASSIKGFKVPPFTTFSTYVVLIRAYLQRTCQLAECNLKVKLDYINEMKTFAFVQLPVSLKHVVEESSEKVVESEEFACVESAEDALFIEILNLVNCPTPIQTPGMPNVAVYTKPGIARFL